MIRIPTIAIAVIVVLVPLAGFTPSSRAEEAVPSEADAIIKACWDSTLDARSTGVGAEMHTGIIESVDCLESAILDQVEILFSNGRYMSIGRAEDLLQMIGWGIGRFYAALYIQNIHCQKKSCGTQWNTAHQSKVAEIFGTIIQDTIEIRNRYNLPSTSGAQ